MKSEKKWAKESSLVNWNYVIYLDEAAFYRGDVTYKKGLLQVNSIQTKEQEPSLNEMCLG